jgi:phosphocarrier protein
MAARNSSPGGDVLAKEFVITNFQGIHMRPASLFVKTANRFNCEVFVTKDGERINGKSIMGLLMLTAGPGCKIIVEASGPDAVAALAELETLVVQRKFDED